MQKRLILFIDLFIDAECYKNVIKIKHLYFRDIFEQKSIVYLYFLRS